MILVEERREERSFKTWFSDILVVWRFRLIVFASIKDTEHFMISNSYIFIFIFLYEDNLADI